QTAGLAEGEHLFRIRVRDASWWDQKRELSYLFIIDRTPPELTVTALQGDIRQGDTGGFFIRANEKLTEIFLQVAGRKYPCYPVPGAVNLYRGLFPVRVFSVPAAYEAQMTGTDLAGNVTRTALPYRVTAREFPREIIQVPKAKAGILTNRPRLNEDAVKIKAALAERGGIQYWRGMFVRPAQGIVSSPFGIQRVYSTGSIASYHRGIDIANKEGTPVIAANAGVVLLSEELFLYGNTIILDHGQGVLTYYCHLSRRDPEKGDIVARGQTIGAIGTTGLSTGPHLHWEMQIEGVEVNPEEWLSRSFEE
ncbi:MAG TPA: M23 family metallopeptidase, partial [Spirochaetia bacterium]|nr:M23 family metallopeptidase [Spirochaetia bacterium]